MPVRYEGPGTARRPGWVPPGHSAPHPGQYGDCPQFIPLLDQVRIARRGTGRRGIQAVIPVKEDQKKNRRARGRSGGRPPA